MVHKLLVIFFILLFVGGVFAYTQPTFEGQPLIVSSDRSFYGSDQGIITIDFNVDNPTSTSYDLYLNLTELYSLGVRVKRLKVDDKDLEVDTGQLKTKTKLRFTKNAQSTGSIELEFDPAVVGIGQEFDVQLLNDAGEIVADLDPFLSGYTYRRVLTITNNYVGTLNDTNSVAIYHITNELGAKALANCYDVRVTYGEVTEVDNNIIGNCQSDANLYVPINTAIGNGSSDAGYYLYYGNAGASAPTSKNIVLPAPDSTGLVFCPLNSSMVNISGGTDCVNSNADETATAVVGTAYTNGVEGDYIETNFIPKGESGLTFEFWINFPDTGKQRFAGGGDAGNVDALQLLIEDNTTLRSYFFIDTVFYDLVSTQTPSTGVYTHIAFTCGSSGAKLWYNGNVVASNVTTNCPNNDTDSLHVGQANNAGAEKLNAGGFFDEIRISNYQKTFFPQPAVNTSAEQPTIGLGAEEQETTDPTFTDLNFFEFDNFTTDLNITVTTDTFGVWDFNVSDDAYDITSGRVWYQVTNSGSDNNCFIHTRNGETCGWGFEDPNFSIIASSDDWNNFRSERQDDHEFKPSAYNLDPDDVSQDGLVSLNNPNDWAKMLITNAKYKSTVDENNYFYNFSFNMDFSGTVNKNLIFYDCNQDVLDPVANINCTSQVVDPDEGKKKDEYYSLFLESNNDGFINDVLTNADGNHWIYLNCSQCNTNNTWDINYDSTNSNIDRTRNWTSINGLSSVQVFAQTFDAHIHWFDLDETYFFNWKVQITDDDGNDFNSSLISQQIQRVNIPPELVSFDNPLADQVVFGAIDVNATSMDGDGDLVTCDLNLFNSSETNFLIDSNVLVVNNVCSISLNTLIYPDGDYHYAITLRDYTQESVHHTDFNFFIDNNAPVIVVVYPNGGEFFENPSSITIDFNVTDAYTPILIDLNYSSSGLQGTGIEVLINESTLGVNIICDGIACSYVWDVSAVADGNYFILIQASDSLYSSFDASDSDFNIYSTSQEGGVYVERYINPESKQRDENRYYDPDSEFNLNEDEKQTRELTQMNTFLLYFGVIIVVILLIIGVVLWKKK